MTKKRKKLKNQGNTFLVVVATVSFLLVLVAALLVAVALCYRLKAYELNSRDNFYYLEQAMDEIYAGIGQDSMKYLNEAYDETLEVLVYYDTNKKGYVTMDNDEANKICKSTFMYKLKHNSAYNSVSTAQSRIISFLSNPYDDSEEDLDHNKISEGIKVDITGNVDTTKDDRVTIYKLVLSRKAKYSTVNARSKQNSGDNVGGGDYFIQSITTDITIANPPFDVNFNTISTGMEDLYEYSTIADNGIEIVGKDDASAHGNSVIIDGNIYAASDFYNKSYNENSTPSTISDFAESSTLGKTSDELVEFSSQMQNVNSYDNDYKKKLDGVNIKSMYSGIYVDGATLTINSNKVVVPGEIAAMNSANVTITSVSSATNDLADVWTDGIVLDGYSVKKSAASDAKVAGSTVNIRANLYVSDDLELNATSSSMLINGNYFGYSDSSTDNRVFTDTAIKNRRYSDADLNDNATKAAAKKSDGRSVAGQAHYNSSAIILNGQDSSLDLSNCGALYVAGQAYVEVSKQTAESEEKEIITAKGTDGAEDVKETITDKSYSYPSYNTTGDKDQQTYTMKIQTEKNESGKLVAKTEKNSNGVAVAKTETAEVQDIKTGEAISIKSNQLAYIPNWSIVSKSADDEMYVSFPDYSNYPPGSGYKEFYDTYKNIWDNLDKVPVIKTVISGKPYYFFDFSQANYSNGKDMSDFIEAYSDLFVKTVDPNSTSGVNSEDIKTYAETVGVYKDYDITDNNLFGVKNLRLKIDTGMGKEKNSNDIEKDVYDVFTNAAITAVDVDGTGKKTFTIKANEKNRSGINAAIASTINPASLVDDRVDISNANATFASDLTKKLARQYKEMKWLLSKDCSIPEYVAEARSLNDDYITPINHFFDFSLIDANSSKFYNVAGQQGVWVSNESIFVSDKGYRIGDDESQPLKGDSTYTDNFNGGVVRGIILAKGDVTFDNSVKEFDGLIVTGGKIIINNFSGAKTEMKLSSNAEVIKSVLKACDESQGEEDSTKNFGIICKMFRQFESSYVEENSAGQTPTDSLKKISAIEFEDIITVNNWIKNVD